MSTPKRQIVKMDCFSGLKLDNPKEKQDTIQESIKEDKNFLVNFFAKQPYYSELMPKIKKASRGIVFYKGLIHKGLKHKSVFFEAIMKSIKKVNQEKSSPRPKSPKRLKLYKLPKIEELRIKKKKIEKIGKKKIKLIQLEKEKLDVYKEQIKNKYFPSTTINRQKSQIYSTNTLNFFNNRYLYSNSSTNNSFNKNGNLTGKLEQNIIISPINNDLSTYYKSIDTFKNVKSASRNRLMFTNKFQPFRINSSSTNLHYLLDKCKEEISNGKEVEELVSNYNKNFMKDVQDKINSNRYINRDKTIIEDNINKKNKYTKLEEKNYAEIKRRMNEKISNSLAYKNRKELREILKINANARSYILHLNEMNKINEKLERRRIIEWKTIDKVNLLCDDGFKRNEYLKNKIDKINKKNDILNKSKDIIINDDFYMNKNEKNQLAGTLIPKLLSIKKANEKNNNYNFI